MLRGLDALESPEILSVEVHGLGVSSAEALSNPSVVEALSVTESEEADPSTNYGAEEQAGEREHDVSIEGYGVEASLGREVPVAEGSTSKGGSEPCAASKNLVALREIRNGNMINVRVMLDEIN